MNGLETTPRFLLSAEEAKAIVRHQVGAIRAHWDQVCDDAQLSAGERDILSNARSSGPMPLKVCQPTWLS